jgi:uncharacterized protein DUF4145
VTQKKATIRVTTFGEVTERPKVRHWKCRVGVKPHRGFESRPLRLQTRTCGKSDPPTAGKSPTPVVSEVVGNPASALSATSTAETPVSTRLDEIVSLPCPECGGGKRNHLTVAHYEWTVRDPLGNPQRHSSSRICQCQGCETVRYVQNRWEEGDILGMESVVYPEAPLRAVQPLDATTLPTKVGRINLDTVKAFTAGVGILAGGGLRAIVEAICKDQGVSGKNLGEKIDQLVKIDLLATPQARFLHEVRYMGNQALHETGPPSEKELELGLQIVHALLTSIYILPGTARELEKLRTSKKGGPQSGEK